MVAYYELGWGGWWFWDPVENASFMPWLVGTALIHSLAVTENAAASRTGRFAGHSGVLAVAARHLPRPFQRTDLGHAFATDPRRGIFILISSLHGYRPVAGAVRLAQRLGRSRWSLLADFAGIGMLSPTMWSSPAVFVGARFYPLLIDALWVGGFPSATVFQRCRLR